MTKPKTSVFTTEVVEEGRVFAENDLAFAFPTNIPITPGHSLVVPKRVVATIDELTAEEMVAMHQLTVIVKNALKQAVGADGTPYGAAPPRCARRRLEAGAVSAVMWRDRR